MPYGITDTGFVIKRLADIKIEIENTVRDTFGSGIDLNPESPLGQIVGIFAEREALLWELSEGVYNSAYPDTAEAVSLDNAVSFTGIIRRGQTFSTVDALFYGTAGTLITAGQIVSVAGNTAARFVSIADVTIGSPVNEIQSATFSAIPASGVWSLIFKAQTTTNLSFDANATAVQTALRALSTLSDDLLVTGDYSSGFTITFAGADGSVNQDQITVGANTLLTAGAAPVTVSIATVTPGIRAQVSGSLLAESPGAVAAPAGSLTVIETPLAGWAGIENPLDAEVGQETETDAELRLRRSISLTKAGAGTLEAIRADLLELTSVESVLVFENSTLTTDAEGRPGKSFETVVLGGVDADIALAIWKAKPAGIQTYGSITVQIIDSQGIPHDILFSRPDEVSIWLELDITTTSAFPANGVTRIRDAILAYGLTLNLGDDVIVYPALIASIGTIPGIIDVAVRIGVAANPTLDNNITINAFEIADFDTSRIEVNIL